ncbi:hypothetical protein Lser_V15G38168 [Lactuca serriola]
MDDIILTGNDASIIRIFIVRLNKEFLITDLGKLSYFLGLDVSYHDIGLFLSQSKYAHDLSYVVNQVNQFLHAPTEDHFQAVKRIIRYVKSTISYGLSFSRASSPTILGYLDVDWARCIETCRSTYDYSIFLGGNLVSWGAKKQPIVSRSSCESEYRALANAAYEIIWITHLLSELCLQKPLKPIIEGFRQFLISGDSPQQQAARGGNGGLPATKGR